MAVALALNRGWNGSLDWVRKRGGCTASEWHANAANCGVSCALANESQHGYHPRTPHPRKPTLRKKKKKRDKRERDQRGLKKQIKKNRKKIYKLFRLGGMMVVIDVSMICTIMYIGQEHTFLFLFFPFMVNLIDKIKNRWSGSCTTWHKNSRCCPLLTN